MKTSTAAKSEEKDSRDDGKMIKELKQTFAGFELFSIYLASGVGGYVAGAIYLAPWIGSYIGSFVGFLFGLVFGLLAFSTYAKSK